MGGGGQLAARGYAPTSAVAKPSNVDVRGMDVWYIQEDFFFAVKKGGAQHRT